MLKRLGMVALLCVWLVPAAVGQDSGKGVADQPFVQEYHEAYPIGEKGDANDVRSIGVDGEGNVWAATKAGVYVLKKGQRTWAAVMKKEDAGPAFAAAVDSEGKAWVGAWNGLYRCGQGGAEKIQGIDKPVSVVYAVKDAVLGAGPDGMWRVAEGKVTTWLLPCSRTVRAMLDDKQSGLWMATWMGLYHHTVGEGKYFQRRIDLLSNDARDLAYTADGSLWIGGLGGVTEYRGGKRVGAFTPKDGLCSSDVRSVTRGPDGVMWVGTALGVDRYDGRNWSLRHSKRWLVSDDVRDVAFGSDGTAWVATAGGVSAIRRKTMTLAEKAKYFHKICMERHVRKPWLVEKCRLRKLGDISAWDPEDDDNDGQYTSMYLAMESFRYAATKNPQARENAKKAFEALRFLQTVTGTPGFVARTVIPVTWKRMHDPNTKLTERQWAEMHVQEPRNKRVPVRWRPSKDGKWLWKGDTSSDEITGHFYGYLVYYDLAADEGQQRVVREHVRKVMDYIIDGGYVLKDIDGAHTRWAVWSPEKLNDDPDWATERGVNSVEILSFLKATHHITGDEKYQKHYRKLIDEHDYATNAQRAKTTNPSWRTHIDDELLALAYSGLLQFEKDAELKEIYTESLDRWYEGIRADRSPYFNYVYGAIIGKGTELETSVAFLRDAPLDLVRWLVDNSEREDLGLTRYPELEQIQTDRLPPASERGVMRWDKNPWTAVQGDGGRTESSGVYWLLPYWMGRYCGFIQGPG